MIRRRFQTRFKALSRQFSIICILGPRQCGKTTFVKSNLKNFDYFDLEKNSDLVRIESDPEDFLKNQRHKSIILDEAQRLPSVFPVLRSFVDEHHKRKERIVLLGSASFDLIKDISESLAGRVGFLDMTPLQYDEVPDWKKLWYRGGFPKAYLEKNDHRRLDWFDNYVRTFIERDIKNMGIELSSPQMRKLWAMLSHVHGGQWNASEVGSSLGMSYHTVNRYVDILEKSFLARKLTPYFVNIGKRLTKVPKIYLRDTGLLHFFLGIHTEKDLGVHFKRGASWESFVIENIIGFLGRLSGGFEFYFYRTSTGQEVDLLIKKGNRLTLVEIKLHSSPKKEDASGLITGMRDLKCDRGYIVRPEGETYSLGNGIRVFSFKKLLEHLKQDLG